MIASIFSGSIEAERRDFNAGLPTRIWRCRSESVEAEDWRFARGFVVEAGGGCVLSLVVDEKAGGGLGAGVEAAELSRAMWARLLTAVAVRLIVPPSPVVGAG
jgi:hypothetical protein